MQAARKSPKQRRRNTSSGARKILSKRTRTSPGRTVQRAKSAATRAALISVARARFTEFGYFATGTTELVALASVTRGALYHHFADKQDLFAAVFRQVVDEISHRTREEAAAHSGNLWDKFKLAVASYLEQRSADREAQRILIVEGPAVFGWDRWRELQSDTLDDFADTFRDLMDQGFIRRLPARPLAGQIVAALNDAALTVAASEQPETELEAQTQTVLALLDGLYCGPA